MTDETIRTKAINVTREHWKTVLHFSSWALAALVAVSVARGHKQAEDASLVTTVTGLSAKMDLVQTQVSQIAIAQAEMRGEMKGVSQNVADVKQWKDDMIEDMREGSKTHVPQFSGHRAKH